jgi:undecaprenyl diphosphate synthase
MQSIVDEKAAAFHVAIIMDGNGRWATRRGLPRSAGHQAGVRAARLVTQAAPDLGVTTLSLFAFSSDNWRRPRAEVNALIHCCGITSLASYGIWWRTEFG